MRTDFAQMEYFDLCICRFVLRSVLFTLQFGGGNAPELFISPSAAAHISSTRRAAVCLRNKWPPTKNPRTDTPSFDFTHPSGGAVECGPCNYYLLLIGYRVSGAGL